MSAEAERGSAPRNPPGPAGAPGHGAFLSSSTVFDLLPHPCFIASYGHIVSVNPSGLQAGLNVGLAVREIDEALANLATDVAAKRHGGRITEWECQISGQKRHYSVTIEPLPEENPPDTVIVFLTDVSHLMDTTDELAQLVIEMEIVNNRLDRSISILSILARFSAELLQEDSADRILAMLRDSLMETRVFEEVRVLPSDHPGIDSSLPEGVREIATRALAANEGIRSYECGRWLICPVAGRKRCYGLIIARSAIRTPDDTGFDVKPFATMASFTLDNMDLYRDLLDNLRDASFRNRAARSLQEAMSALDIERRLGDMLREHMAVSWFRFVRTETAEDVPPEMREMVRLGFHGHRSARMLPGGSGIVVPLRHAGAGGEPEAGTSGVFAAFSESAAAFEDRGRELFYTLIDLASISLRNVQMYADLRAHNVAVQYLNEELARTVMELKAANEMKSKFVSIVSHEFRTPLTSISSYVETLQMDFDVIDRETSRHFLGVIREETERLARLINQLLDLARIKAMDRPLATKDVDVAAMAERVADQLRPVAVRKDLTLRSTVAAGPLVVSGDADALRQVLLNLVGNALRYTLPGGEVEIRVEGDPRFVYIRVRDTGIGIPDDSLDAIFSEFFTVSQTRARLARDDGGADALERSVGGSGTGLGLSIARAIIERHKGRIEVSSNVGVGSEFVVALMRKGAEQG